MKMRLLLLFLVTTCALPCRAQVINRAPHFIQNGDMARLAVPESTPPGSPVYSLRGEDPEGSRLHYSISGEYFTVNRDTGLVVLRRPLDRETQDLIEVIISITGKFSHYFNGNQSCFIQINYINPLSQSGTYIYSDPALFFLIPKTFMNVKEIWRFIIH